MPTIVAQDTFTDTDGVLLPAHSPDVGGSWEKLDYNNNFSSMDSNVEVRSNRASSVNTSSSLLATVYRLTTAPGSSRFKVEVTPLYTTNRSISNRFAIFFGVSTTGTSSSEVDSFRVSWTDNTSASSRALTIARRTGGTTTVLASKTDVSLNGTTDVLGVVVERLTDGRSVIEATINGTQVITAITDVENLDTLHVALGLPQSDGSTAAADDFIVTALPVSEADFPAEENVRQGVTYDGETKTGTLDLPAEEDVRDTVTYDNETKTGTLDLPAEEDVKQGVTYDNETKTGTFEGEGGGEGGGDGRRPIEQFWFG